MQSSAVNYDHLSKKAILRIYPQIFNSPVIVKIVISGDSIENLLIRQMFCDQQD